MSPCSTPPARREARSAGNTSARKMCSRSDTASSTPEQTSRGAPSLTCHCDPNRQMYCFRHCPGNPCADTQAGPETGCTRPPSAKPPDRRPDRARTHCTDIPRRARSSPSGPACCCPKHGSLRRKPRWRFPNNPEHSASSASSAASEARRSCRTE